MQDLFRMYVNVGIRAQVPKYISRFQLFGWMNTDFLDFKSLKRFEDGSKYTAANIPVIIAAIIHLITKDVITLNIDLCKIFHDKNGDMKEETDAINDYRLSVPINFKVNSVNMTFNQLMMYLIYGCYPFVIPKQTKVPDLPTDFGNLMKHFNGITLETMMQSVLQGKLIEKKVATKPESITDGYLPNEDVKQLNKIIGTYDNADVRKKAVYSFLHYKEVKYLNLASNIRWHMKTLAKKNREIDAAAEAGPMFPVPATDEANSREESPALDYMEGFRFLKEPPKSKKDRREFPFILQHFGDDMHRRNVRLIRSLDLDAASNEDQGLAMQWAQMVLKDKKPAATGDGAGVDVQIAKKVTATASVQDASEGASGSDDSSSESSEESEEEVQDAVVYDDGNEAEKEFEGGTPATPKPTVRTSSKAASTTPRKQVQKNKSALPVLVPKNKPKMSSEEDEDGDEDEEEDKEEDKNEEMSSGHNKDEDDDEHKDEDEVEVKNKRNKTAKVQGNEEDEMSSGTDKDEEVEVQTKRKKTAKVQGLKVKQKQAKKNVESSSVDDKDEDENEEKESPKAKKAATGAPRARQGQRKKPPVVPVRRNLDRTLAGKESPYEHEEDSLNKTPQKGFLKKRKHGATDDNSNILDGIMSESIESAKKKSTAKKKRNDMNAAAENPHETRSRGHTPERRN
jgi:hypothetical protein